MGSSRTVTGVLVVKDSAHTVDLTIKSSMHSIDDYIIVDNCSEDDTLEIVESTVDEFGLDAKITKRPGFAGYLVTDAIRDSQEFAVRLEGDQVYFRDKFSKMVDMAVPESAVSASVYLLRNRTDLTRADMDTNAPHPMVYYNDDEVQHYEGLDWPRAYGHRRLRFRESPIGVNLNIASPSERIKRWHRSSWWERGDDSIPPWMELDGYERPFQDHFTLEEYVWKLREEGKGSYLKGWHGETLDEIGEEYVKWDIKNNCSTYNGPIPDVLEEAIKAGRFNEYEISV